MVDSGPYPSDGENPEPGKHRHDKRSGRHGPRDGNPRIENGYDSDRTASRSQHDRNHHRHRDEDVYPEERTNSRHHDDKGRGRYQERDRHYEEQRKERHPRERGREGYRERDPNRHPTERSWSHYEERDSHRSQSHYPERDAYHQERSHQRSDERERQQERYLQSVEKQGLPASSRHPDRYYQPERSLSPNDSQMNDMEYYEPEAGGGILDCHKCRYLCTGRACCQLVEVLLNMLILICCSVSYNSTGGYTGIASLGGIYYYQFGGAYSGLSGADGEKAQALDVQFYQLKLPTVTASMAFGGAIMAFSCLLVLLGVLRVPWRWPLWLLVECALDVAIALGYIPALYFYFRYLQEAYSSQVCKDREALYSSKGYQGFSCALHGADIAAALFACMAVIAFFMSAWLAVKGFRTVRRTKKKPVNTLEF